MFGLIFPYDFQNIVNIFNEVCEMYRCIKDSDFGVTNDVLELFENKNMFV